MPQNDIFVRKERNEREMRKIIVLSVVWGLGGGFFFI